MVWGTIQEEDDFFKESLSGNGMVKGKQIVYVMDIALFQWNTRLSSVSSTILLSVGSFAIIEAIGKGE